MRLKDERSQKQSKRERGISKASLANYEFFLDHRGKGSIFLRDILTVPICAAFAFFGIAKWIQPWYDPVDRMNQAFTSHRWKRKHLGIDTIEDMSGP